MAIINLRKHYYPLYTTDTFVEVPDEVAAVMEECRLYENRQEGRKSYYHVYSMDCSSGIENHAMFLVQSPEDLIIREIDEAAEELLLERLAEAITQLSTTQARRLRARYALKKKFREIAADEGVSGNCAPKPPHPRQKVTPATGTGERTPSRGPRANPAKRGAWGEEGQRNGVQFSPQAETERSGFCPDEEGGVGGLHQPGVGGRRQAVAHRPPQLQTPGR